MADAARSIWNSIVSTKRMILNPHEQYGRANIFRACVLSYACIYLYLRARGQKKERALQQQKLTEKKSAVSDALARAGLA
ncbi:hypothetical protein WR25_01159 [Diploscapter pachys]|uniref:Uncharacterized protein n=1 Tax=Diploscapter pachys TaxID=2018661 RepID=A0A2A2KBH1_9BILA|nr:hypothetical protein WR25_01159 [Diploscapter pachys]